MISVLHSTLLTPALWTLFMIQNISTMRYYSFVEFFCCFLLLPAVCCCCLLLPAAACSLHLVGSSETGMLGQGPGLGLNLCQLECVLFFYNFKVMQFAVHSWPLRSPKRTKRHRQDGPTGVTRFLESCFWNSGKCYLIVLCVFPLCLCFCVCVCCLCVCFFLCLFLLVPGFFKINFVMDWPKTSPWQNWS